MCHSCFKGTGSLPLYIYPIELRYTRITVVWQSLRLYCSSLAAWIYIDRFLGEKFFVFWFLVFGSKQNKELPHTYLLTTFRGFSWLASSEITFPPPRKKIFHLDFSEIRRINFYLTGKHIQQPKFSLSLTALPFSRITTTNCPRDPSFHVLPPRHTSTSFDQHRRHRPNLAPIRCSLPSLKNFWKSPGNSIIHVLRVIFPILHYFKPLWNRSLPQTLFSTSLSAIIKDLLFPGCPLYESYTPVRFATFTSIPHQGTTTTRT